MIFGLKKLKHDFGANFVEIFSSTRRLRSKCDCGCVGDRGRGLWRGRWWPDINVFGGSPGACVTTYNSPVIIYFLKIFIKIKFNVGKIVIKYH